MRDYDLIIVGAGPAGLSLAARLAQAPLRIALIDKEPRQNLASPSYDGREIALESVLERPAPRPRIAAREQTVFGESQKWRCQDVGR